MDPIGAWEATAAHAIPDAHGGVDHWSGDQPEIWGHHGIALRARVKAIHRSWGADRG